MLSWAYIQYFRKTYNGGFENVCDIKISASSILTALQGPV